MPGVKEQEEARVPIFGRIPFDVRNGLRESAEANGRKWERELEEAIRFYLLERGQK